MEALLTSLSVIVDIISSDLWLFIIITAFISSKDHRIAGLFLIAMQVTFGYHQWIFIVVVFITLLTDFLSPKRHYEKKYKKKIDALNKMNEQNPAAWRVINGGEEDE